MEMRLLIDDGLTLNKAWKLASPLSKSASLMDTAVALATGAVAVAAPATAAAAAAAAVDA